MYARWIAMPKNSSSGSDLAEYDYIACLYPEGNLRADKCVFFNNEDIAEIIHRGFYG